jgi:transposase-like protein
MAIIKVSCRFCKNTDSVRKHSMGSTGYQRYRCLDCKRTFQLNYVYKACYPEIKNKIVDMAMNSSGVRDTARVLNVGYNTVLRVLKNFCLSK